MKKESDTMYQQLEELRKAWAQLKAAVLELCAQLAKPLAVWLRRCTPRARTCGNCVHSLFDLDEGEGYCQFKYCGVFRDEAACEDGYAKD